MTPALRLVFWETTKACNLSCRHCRAVPQKTLGASVRRRQDFDDHGAGGGRQVR